MGPHVFGVAEIFLKATYRFQVTLLIERRDQPADSFHCYERVGIAYVAINYYR
jgi:hypothetical protein